MSSADFPALNADVPSPSDAQPAEAPSPAEVGKAQAKAERKAAKKAAAAERALERQKAAQEKAAVKAAEKARIAQEKAEKLAKEKEEREISIKEKAEKDRLEVERQAQEKAMEEERAALKALAEKAQAEKAIVSQARTQKNAKSASAIKVTRSGGSSGQAPVTPITKQSPIPPKASEPVEHAPILSKMPKKNKPVTRPIKIPKEDDVSPGDASAAPSFSASEPVNFPPSTTNIVISSSNNSREQSVETSYPLEPISIACLLDDIDVRFPNMDLPNHPFFDMTKINPAAKMPLEYGPLVHALSALSVGGGSFATNMPSGSIDNAVSSFQQLLETLTQTISDLLRLLPRTTWDDSSSFDGVLRDMLKGDDFLDDGGDDAAGKEDEVAALTLALERRARWMEVQLSKLEELHRDINTAAVRAVLAFNDSGWDRHIFMPRVGNTLRRFDNIGMVEEGGKLRPMTVDELEKKLQVAKEAAIFAETEFREAMENLQPLKPIVFD